MLNRSPLVSVHIITYNQVGFIHETLSSALEQDYENLEVVVSDDGSTDGTAEVILEYAEKYPRRLVPLVGGENLGITGNSNRALKACKGKYIAFQGGDDVLLPGKISTQVAWMEEGENRILCGHQVEVFYDDGTPSHVLTPFLSSGVGCKWLIENGCPYGATSIMVRRDYIPKRGFDESLHWGSDLMLWVECLQENKKWGYVSGTYAQYRKHANNISGLGSCLKVIDDIEKMFDILEKRSFCPRQSIDKGRRNLVYIPRAKALIREGFYVSGMPRLLTGYLLSPSYVLRAVILRLRKLLGY